MAAVTTQEASKERQSIESWLIERVTALRGNTTVVDPNQKLETLGLDSMAAVELTGELEGWLGRRLAPTLFFEYDTIAEIARHLENEEAFPTSTVRQHVDPVFEALEYSQTRKL